MTPTQLKRLDKELTAFLAKMTDGMGRPERRRALEWYLTGLLLDGGRKTVVGMASRLVDDEHEIEAMRQRLQQCVTISAWADEEVRRRLAEEFEKQLHPEAFILDDTGFPKQGFPRRASCRSECTGNTQAPLVESTIARSRPACT